MTQLLHALKMTLIDAQIFNQNLNLTRMTLRQIWKSIMLDDVLPELSVINIMKLVVALKDFAFHDKYLTVTDLMTADTNDHKLEYITENSYLLPTIILIVIYDPKAYFDQQDPAQT